jgi:flagellar basal-body rod protein FlgF
MDRMIYNAMAGAKAAMQRQDVLSHNLANVSTTGFRAEMASFRAVPVRGDGASTRVYALETTLGHDDKAGPWNRTDRKLDVALVGKSWLAVQGLDGTEAYTRAGHLDINAEGLLVTPNGLPVLGRRRPRHGAAQHHGADRWRRHDLGAGRHRPPHHRRPPQARDARGQAAAR